MVLSLTGPSISAGSDNDEGGLATNVKAIQLICPRCKGEAVWHLEEGRVQCRCGFQTPIRFAGVTLSGDQVRQLFQTRSVGPLHGLRSKSNKQFSAHMNLTKWGLQYESLTAADRKATASSSNSWHGADGKTDDRRKDLFASEIRRQVKVFEAVSRTEDQAGDLNVYKVIPSTVLNYESVLQIVKERAIRDLTEEYCASSLDVAETEMTARQWGSALLNATWNHPNWQINTRFKAAAALRWYFRQHRELSNGSIPWEVLNAFVVELETRQVALRKEIQDYKRGAIKNQADLQFPFEVLVSSQKRKTFNERDLYVILDELSSRHCNPSRGKKIKDTPRKVKIWTDAGLVTGLRTCEWLSAFWVDESKTVLITNNAKAKLDIAGFLREYSRSPRRALGRINGIEGSNSVGDALINSDIDICRTRAIPIGTKRDREYVDLQLELFRSEVMLPGVLDEENRKSQEDVRFQKYRKKCQQYLHRLCIQLWPDDPSKRYCLYNARGQFSANMRSLHGLEKTAKLMGHARADSPSAAGYGQRNQAHSDFKSKRSGPLLSFKHVEKNLQPTGSAHIQAAVKMVGSASGVEPVESVMPVQAPVAAEFDDDGETVCRERMSG